MGLVAVLALVCVPLLFVASYSLRVNDASAVAENVPAEALIGECFGNDASQRTVPCDGDHHFEVFSIVEYDSARDYPSNLIRTLGNNQCDGDFTPYTGDNYFASAFDYHEVYPSEQDWAAGDRRVPCAIHRGGLEPIGKVFSP